MKIEKLPSDKEFRFFVQVPKLRGNSYIQLINLKKKRDEKIISEVINKILEEILKILPERI